jgi:peptidoglycan/xylan/chitin deacetylase (PgdA/CDA1 family)
VAEGHELINHSYDHASFTGYSSRIAALSQEQRWSELDRTEAIIRQITGASTKPYFRPPFGDYDQTVLEDVFARGYAYSVMWSADSDGWRGDSADEIVTTCLAEAKPGAIYIFHVGSASQDAAALQRVIEGLRALGYGFVALSSVAPR